MGSKKAMSPLFSTVILIGFAIALGGIVMSWGKEGYVSAKPIVCEEASLNIVGYGYNQGVCATNGRLYFTIQNDGSIDLNGIKADIIGENDIYSSTVNVNLMVADIKKLNFDYEGIGNIEKVIFVPKFTYLGQEKLCPQNSVSIENIGEC